MSCAWRVSWGNPELWHLQNAEEMGKPPVWRRPPLLFEGKSIGGVQGTGFWGTFFCRADIQPLWPLWIEQDPAGGEPSTPWSSCKCCHGQLGDQPSASTGTWEHPGSYGSLLLWVLLPWEEAWKHLRMETGPVPKLDAAPGFPISNQSGSLTPCQASNFAFSWSPFSCGTPESMPEEKILQWRKCSNSTC